MESHHCWPKSLNGVNKKWNLVNLTAREHFLAHWMLWKALRNTSMTSAFWTQSNVNGVRLNSKTYSILKEELANNLRIIKTGTRLSQTTRLKISSSLSGLMVGDKNPMYGRTLSKDHKAKMSKSLTGLLAGDRNPMRGTPPWLNPKTKDSHRLIWSKAQDIYKSWVDGGRKGGYLMSKQFGIEFNRTAENIHMRFKGGWVPNEDPIWVDWKNGLEKS